MVNIKEVKSKICLIGDWGVGKTSLIRKFVLDQFDDKYLVTFGTKVTKKRVKFKKDSDNIIDLNLVIWDVMGQKEFKKARKLAYQGVKGALIVCDITRKETLFSIPEWKDELYSVTGKIPFIILVNKIDLKESAKFSPKDIKEISEQLNMPYYTTSAKTGENVETSFIALGKKIINKLL